MKKPVIILVISLLLLVPLSAYIGYDIDKAEHKDDYSLGYAAGKTSTDTRLSDMESVSKQLSAENERLVNDYNSLVDKANALLSTRIYQPKQSFSCMSTTLGSYFPTTYTNCY